MPEVETVAAESSPETPAAPQVDPLQEGPMVNWTREQRNDFRTTGKMPEKPKADAAPAAKPSEASAESAAASETAKSQEHTSKPKQTAEERIAQLEATIEKIRKGAGLNPTPKAESSPAQPEPKQESKPQPAQNFKEWFKAFEAEKWQEEYAKANPRATYERMNAELAVFLNDVKDGFKERDAQIAARDREMNEKLNEAKSKYPNFDEIMWPTLNEITSDQGIHQSVKDTLDESDLLPHVLYVIGETPENLADFRQMARNTPSKAKRHIFNIENLIRSEFGKSEKPPPKIEAAPVKQQTLAPKPPAEVGGRANAPGDSLVAAAAANDFRTFKAELNRRALASRKTG